MAQAPVGVANIMIDRAEQSEEDLGWMDQACLMAEEALANAEIPVGCVLVHEGRIIACGRNRTNESRNATLHAEFDALSHLLPERTHPHKSPPRPFTATSVNPTAEEAAAVLAEWEAHPRRVWETPLRDVVLYVTVEPCIMCAAVMRQVGIEKVIYGCANDRFGGCGGVQSIHADERLKYSPPYSAVGGYRREEGIMLLRRFYISENTTAPKPKNKKNRVLKTDIVDIPLDRISPAPSGTSTPQPSAAEPLDGQATALT